MFLVGWILEIKVNNYKVIKYKVIDIYNIYIDWKIIVCLKWVILIFIWVVCFIFYVICVL